MRWSFRTVVALTAVCLFFAGCGGPTRGIETPAEMKRIIGARVPMGSPLDDARRFLEREGFQCSLQTNSFFADDQGRVHEGIDYLWCGRSEGTIVQRRWQIVVVERDGKVVEVFAHTGLIGP